MEQRNYYLHIVNFYLYVDSWHCTWWPILLSKLVPILKNKRGNKSDSSNCQAIAIGSLLGKIFDFFFFSEQCKNLQFGFNVI